MMIRAWRIVKAKHASTAFSGDGAKKFGSRWSSPGLAVVYVASSASLAMLEVLVHSQSQELLKRSYVLFEVTFNEKLLTAVDPAAMPRAWRKFPPQAPIQQIGDNWIARADSAVLRVPSVIVPTEWNYLLNPAHPDFKQITIGSKQPVQFDPRLLKL